jgi:hypothetical protein
MAFKTSHKSFGLVYRTDMTGKYTAWEEDARMTPSSVAFLKVLYSVICNFLPSVMRKGQRNFFLRLTGACEPVINLEMCFEEAKGTSEENTELLLHRQCICET